MEPVKVVDTCSPPALAWRALEIARGLLDAARIAGRPHEMWQAESQVARCLQATGDFSGAEQFLSDALRWATAIPYVDARVESLCELAELACTAAEHVDPEAEEHAEAQRQRAREHAGEAVRLAARVADVYWEVKVLLRASEVLERCGDHDEAADVHARALSLLAPLHSEPFEGAGEAPRLPGGGRST